MMGKIEGFGGAIAFDPLWGIVDFLLISHFLLSWWRSARRTGWKIDFWYFTLLIGVFQYLLILYPFNASILNTKVICHYQVALMPCVDFAFAIGVLGYVSLWIGRFSCDLLWKKWGSFSLFTSCVRNIESNFKSAQCFWFFSWITCFLGCVLLAIQFANGNFFHGREFFLENDRLRPLFNLMFGCCLLFFTWFALRFAQKKDVWEWVPFGVILGFSICSGVRSIALMGMVQIAFQLILKRRGRISLLRLFLFLPLLFFAAVWMGNMRHGIFNPWIAVENFFIHYLYGNNFSDNRDFACLLAYWDGEFLLGKSYVAGLFSFIPRTFLSLREEWSFALISNHWMNLDSAYMPGLRPGLFGESFFNFGLPGVVVLGWAWGFALRYADFKIKETLETTSDLIQGYAHTLLFSFVGALAITSGLWAFYIFVLVHLSLTALRKFRVVVRAVYGKKLS